MSFSLLAELVNEVDGSEIASDGAGTAFRTAGVVIQVPITLERNTLSLAAGCC
jgi:hypothetical protein